MHTTNYLVPLQTWDLLRIMFQGFIGLCKHFLSRYPGYFITPVRTNGSAIESYFSQQKYAVRGQLSAINYETAQAALETTKGASTKRPHEADHRDAGLDICLFIYMLAANATIVLSMMQQCPPNSSTLDLSHTVEFLSCSNDVTLQPC